jgi:hypothetical protein
VSNCVSMSSAHILIRCGLTAHLLLATGSRGRLALAMDQPSLTVGPPIESDNTGSMSSRAAPVGTSHKSRPHREASAAGVRVADMGGEEFDEATVGVRAADGDKCRHRSDGFVYECGTENMKIVSSSRSCICAAGPVIGNVPAHDLRLVAESSLPGGFGPALLVFL